MRGNTGETFRNLILNRLRVLEGNIVLDEGADTARHADEIDNSVIHQHRQIDVTLGSIKKAEISELKDALVKIDEGTFGICEECEMTIPAKRLSIHPAARLCVKCQESHEKSGRKNSNKFFNDINIAVLEQRAAS